MDYRQKTDAPVLESPQDAVLQEDLEQLLQDGMVPFELLKNKTVFVTATACLGQIPVFLRSCAASRKQGRYLAGCCHAVICSLCTGMCPKCRNARTT